MVKGLFDADQEFPSVAAALEEHKAERNLDLEQLLQSWALPQRSANAARLCCAIRTAVGSSGGSAGVTAEPVSEGWTTDSWAQADELRLLRRDGSLLTALSKARCPHPTPPTGRGHRPLTSEVRLRAAAVNRRETGGAPAPAATASPGVLASTTPRPTSRSWATPSLLQPPQQ